MCLSGPQSLHNWYQTHPNVISDTDFARVYEMFCVVWEHLDHTRKYCLHPGILIAELSIRCGGGSYPGIRRFTGLKGKQYERLIDYIWSVHTQRT